MITLDMSGPFTFDTNNGRRKVIFTGDTGLFPTKKGASGEAERDQKENPVLDIEVTKALYNQYPEEFINPDLIVAHIGSIKEGEFTTSDFMKLSKKKQQEKIYFYPNHLGLRGLVMLLDKLRPKVAIISEFGEELKTIRFDLIRGIEKMLERRRAEMQNKVFVIPGDLTVVYDINRSSFFCHDTLDFQPVSEVEFLEMDEPEESRFYCRDVKRTYLFKKPAPEENNAKYTVESYHLGVKHHGQPYCKCIGIKVA